jgi:cell division protein FtsB
MWRSVGFGVFLMVVLVFAAFQQFELNQYGYQISDAQEQLEKEAGINRQLRLELETLRAPAFVAKAARRQLHMVEPGPADAIVVERVFETAAPPKSVVAQR